MAICTFASLFCCFEVLFFRSLLFRIFFRIAFTFSIILFKKSSAKQQCGTRKLKQRNGPISTPYYCSVVQRQTAVTAYFSSKQLLLFAFAMQSASNKGGVWPARLILIQRDAKQQSQV